MGGCVLLCRCVFVVPPERNDDMEIDGQILSVGSGDMVCKVPRRGAMYRARGEQARNMGRPHARKRVGARFSTEGGLTRTWPQSGPWLWSPSSRGFGLTTMVPMYGQQSPCDSWIRSGRDSQDEEEWMTAPLSSDIVLGYGYEVRLL